MAEQYKLEIDNNAGTQFFKKNEKVFLEEFAEKSIAAFREAGTLFGTDSEQNLSIDTHAKDQLFENKLEELQNVFQNLCVIKKKNEIKSEIRDNIARDFYYRNLKKRVFNCYKSHFQQEQYLRQMTEYVDTQYRREQAKKVLKCWQKQTMNENRIALKNSCLKKTDLELQKMQREYESLIGNLEQVLSQKLMQLKREEEEHRSLAEKYDTMVQKRQMETNQQSN